MAVWTEGRGSGSEWYRGGGCGTRLRRVVGRWRLFREGDGRVDKPNTAERRLFLFLSGSVHLRARLPRGDKADISVHGLLRVGAEGRSARLASLV